MTNRFAVIGSPISHSKSPILHESAFRVLGLSDQYSAVDVAATRLRQFVETLDGSWRGLSVTMPLKEEAARFASRRDAIVDITGVANTLNLEGGQWVAYNTDVFGIQQALQAPLSKQGAKVLIIGSGATASSAVFSALLANSSAQVTLVARDRRKVLALRERAKTHGFRIRAKGMRSVTRAAAKSDIVITTLPSHGIDDIAEKLGKNKFFKPRGSLLDVSYEPWPSEIAKLWRSHEKTTVSGLEMLIFQAIAQLRIFHLGASNEALPNERAVELAMRDSLGLI